MIIPAIETTRLRLRPYIESDIAELVPLIGAREVAVFTLRIPHPYTEQDARDFIAMTRNDDEVRLGITLRTDGRLCGGVGLRPELQHQRAELGYWIGVPYWGNGYATEAARAMLHYGFETLKLNRIEATHVKQNSASGRILVKLGMRHEGCLREHVCKWGEFVDLECYGMLRREWEHR
ncbi:MAG TPA: GNAT family protein [Candidatus Sulfotelmatobacter sp.]|jgi:[ribosomal protein S5]-alanine N-acetyltransferase